MIVSNRTKQPFSNITSTKYLLASLIVVSALVGIDICGDFAANKELSSIIFDVMIELVILVFTIGLSLLLAYQYSNERRKNMDFCDQIESLHQDIAFWKGRTQSLVGEFQQNLEAQFEQWNLSQSEREICKFMLKGMSFKEMAFQRNSSENTIRNQAQAIYEKSGIKGRKELAAYFLEEMLS